MPHGLSLGLLWALYRADVLHVPARKMNEAKQDDVMEEKRDGEERGIPAF